MCCAVDQNMAQSHGWKEKEMPTDRTLVSPSVCPVCPTSPPHWVSLDFPAHIMGARRYFGQKRIDLGVLWPLLLHGLGCCSSEVMETEYPTDSSKGTFLSPLLFRWGPQLLRLVGSEQLNWWFMSSGQDGGGWWEEGQRQGAW